MHASGRAAFLALLAVLAAIAVVGCGSSDSSASGSDASPGVVRITWQKPANDSDQAGYEALKAAAVQPLAEMLPETFELPQTLTVEGVPGTNRGPAFDPDSNTVKLPYGFAAIVSEAVRQGNAGSSKQVQDERATAAQDMIFEHLLGHALIADYELAAGGKEEDLADEIGTILLLKEREGARRATEAAIFLANYSDSQQPPLLGNYVNAHGLDLTHALDILCWSAGSSEKSREEVAEIGAIGEATQCPPEFEQVSSNVSQQLGDHLKAGASLAPAP